MELDDLKARWQKEIHQHTESNKKNMKELHALLHGKTMDFITTVRKKYERIISIMMLSMMLTVLIQPIMNDGFTFPGSTSGFVKMVFFYLLLIFFYWTKLLAISNLRLSDHIEERLTQLLSMSKRNLRIEVLFVIGFVITLILVGWFFYGKGMANLDDLGVRISLPLTFIFTGAFIYVIIRRHKKQIAELQSLLNEYKNGK